MSYLRHRDYNNYTFIVNVVKYDHQSGDWLFHKTLGDDLPREVADWYMDNIDSINLYIGESKYVYAKSWDPTKQKFISTKRQNCLIEVICL